jgi:hypothetical protein
METLVQFLSRPGLIQPAGFGYCTSEDAGGLEPLDAHAVFENDDD